LPFPSAIPPANTFPTDTVPPVVAARNIPPPLVVDEPDSEILPVP
jgi:hypothetical protein